MLSFSCSISVSVRAILDSSASLLEFLEKWFESLFVSFLSLLEDRHERQRKEVRRFMPVMPLRTVAKSGHEESVSYIAVYQCLERISSSFTFAA